MKRTVRIITVVGVLSFFAGFFSASSVTPVYAQKQPARFMFVREEPPFRLWKDTQTNQCFIVSSPPSYSMLSVGPC